MTLASLDDAKLQLHVTDPARDAEVTLFLEHASAAIFDHLGTRADPEWDADTAPALVQRATLQMLGHLWEHRGDDAAAADVDKVWAEIRPLLMNLRDIGLA